MGFCAVKDDFRVLDSRGVVKLQINDGQLLRTCAGRFASDMDAFLQNVSSYNDAGQILPEVFVLHGSRIADLSSVLVHDQVMQLAGLELEGASPICRFAYWFTRENKSGRRMALYAVLYHTDFLLEGEQDG